MVEPNLIMFEDDYTKVNQILTRLLEESSSKFVLLVDRSGQMISIQGETETIDSMAFATLSAGNYAATSELAKIIGEREFSVLFHQGESESIHISIVAKRIILVVVFDNRTTLGLVRLRVKKAIEDLTPVFNSIFEKVAVEEGEEAIDTKFQTSAEEEIDKLFRE
ncbi:MAG: dynein regulation protein LC7 [Candidatus Coatesbacteria bacterium 4484_99]|uniref:Dynein regulation protein LC7 n=1 Tax=Candidatus Coatesbacteria bacterium 4484_99 TaxID=1970774 RepID=A0A1W9S352_9BACT|nr:MAG: dynein regulation protein LC7 [Candidatus Coatesbacteria bacterium 4484_99]RLC43705.1 MAG: roadblock/LC7 domain-containing protein [Candidatus Coatesbacteria bacterium]RLC44569.1 MAG: roadblock/LC7 domain-containing protein [Candidatus Coatesbacteria bacterium]